MFDENANVVRIFYSFNSAIVPDEDIFSHSDRMRRQRAIEAYCAAYKHVVGDLLSETFPSADILIKFDTGKGKVDDEFVVVNDNVYGSEFDQVTEVLHFVDRDEVWGVFEDVFQDFEKEMYV